MNAIKKHILFVCTGNTCRSAFCEKLLKKMLHDRYKHEAEKIRVSSAGTYAFTGIEPPPDAQKIALEFGIDLSDHRSRSVNLTMMESADVVLCMTAQHKAHLVAKFPWFEDKIFVLERYVSEENENPETDIDDEKYNIPDPIGQGPEVYRKVFCILSGNLEKLLDNWETEEKFRMKMCRTYKIAVASDHAGYHLKEHIKKFLEKLGHLVTDFGVNDGAASVDYPDFAKPVAQSVSKGSHDYGLLVCGSGIGMAIAANRVKKTRAVQARDTITAKLSRSHNNSNVLCLGERLTTPMVAEEIVSVWLSTPYEGGRHEQRIKKMDKE